MSVLKALLLSRIRLLCQPRQSYAFSPQKSEWQVLEMPAMQNLEPEAAAIKFNATNLTKKSTTIESYYNFLIIISRPVL